MQKQRGFTLIETLIAVAIFALIFVVVADIAIIFLKNPQKIMQTKKTESEMDYCMEFIAQKLRTNTIDYARYVSTSTDITLSSRNPSNILYLINDQGVQSYIYYRTTDSYLYYHDGSTSVTINSSEVIFSNIDFYISPTTDPFTEGTTTVNDQPRVTILMQGHYNTGSYESVDLQSTIVSRIYER